MSHSSTCRPAVGIIDGSFVVYDENHRFLHSKTNLFQHSHSIQHVLCTISATNQLSFCNRQCWCLLDLRLLRNWSLFQKYCISANTCGRIMIRLIAGVSTSFDSKFKFWISIPFSIWSKCQSSTHSCCCVSHRSIHCVDVILRAIGIVP
jgi:hypothetical protein